MGVQGVERELVISEVPAACPGLVGPSELSAWQMNVDFEAKTFYQRREDSANHLRMCWSSVYEFVGVYAGAFNNGISA